MGLELYAKIEEHLDFFDEVRALHKTFLTLLFENDAKKVLDVGCGQGEFLHILALNNIEGFGVDLSQNQIDICLAKGLNAKCIDVKDVQEKYEAVTAIFDVINYIPKDMIEEFFTNIKNKLENKGVFIFDINTLFGFEEVAQGSLIIDKDDKFIAIDANFSDKTLTTDITLFEKEDNLYKKEKDSITQYYHSKEFLKKILKKLEFKIEIIDFELHGFGEADKQIYICKK